MSPQKDKSRKKKCPLQANCLRESSSFKKNERKYSKDLLRERNLSQAGVETQNSLKKEAKTWMFQDETDNFVSLS